MIPSLVLVNSKADSLQAFHGKRELLTSRHTDVIGADIIEQKCSVMSIREYMVQVPGIDRAPQITTYLSLLPISARITRIMYRCRGIQIVLSSSI